MMFRQRSTNSVYEDSLVLAPSKSNDPSLVSIQSNNNDQKNTMTKTKKKDARYDQIHHLLAMIICCFLASIQFLKTYDFVIIRIPTTATIAPDITKDNDVVVESASYLPTRIKWNDTSYHSEVVAQRQKSKAQRTKKAHKKISTLSRKVDDTFAIPKGMLEWRPSSTKNPLLTRTLCTSSAVTYPAPTLKSMFAKNKMGMKKSNWSFKVETTQTHGVKACKNSLIRIIWDAAHGRKGKIPRQRLQQHKAGQQLTTSIIGGYIDKSTLFELIQQKNATTTAHSKNTNHTTTSQDVVEGHVYKVLRNAIPKTIVFESEQSCHQFCSETNLKEQEWLWKPRDSNKGNGIRIVEDDTSCRSNCAKTKGLTQVQELTSTMLVPDNGHKFDVRSHLLIGNVQDPMVVYAGAEKVRVCAEPYDKQDPIPFPNSTTDTNFNPFQQVCNIYVGKQHPTWRWQDGVGPLSLGIPDEATRQRVLAKIDQVNLALVDLLSNRWKGKVGMFQVFGIDYLVDKNENIWILEINEQPGFSGVLTNLSPNPWPDILQIEWGILSMLGNSSDVGEDANMQRQRLKQTLSEMELSTLRMLRVGDLESAQ